MGGRIGVDIGGTFTDIVLARGDGRLFVHKISSTTQAPEAAVVQGVAEILALAGMPAAAVVEVLHGTTVGSNTILQRAGAATGLITTRGFRDVLEIGRVRTPDLFDLAWDKPEPLVPRRHRLEVAGRIAADGSVVTPLDEAGVIEAADQLVGAGVESLAVAFINSYRNPDHERRAVALIAARHPRLTVCASVDILPEIKEYERTSTAVVNAYVLPVLRRYLDALSAGLAGLGVTAPLLVVTSNGGLARVALARDKPVFFIGSGPAAGVVGAARLGQACGTPDLIAFDMGGTTAKASLVQGGAVARINEYEFRAGLSTPSRFIKAGGYMLKVPAIDVAEVGAGAGSIASVDAAGLLRVGPQSAGGDPGPACYGRGGLHATVTDANVVLGFLNPDHLAGGTLKLQPALARAAVARDVAGPLGLSVEEAAHGIRQVANASMARALRAVTVERGVDPRDFVLVAFGGSGPVHACDLAAVLSVKHVIVPNLPGVFTALGMLAGDVERHYVRAFPGSLADLAAAGDALHALDAEARGALAEEGYAGDAATVELSADLRLAGQDSELTIALPGATLAPADIETLAARFYDSYEQTYQYRPDEPVEVVNLRATGRGLRRERLDFAAVAVADADATSGGTRRTWFGRDAGFVETPVVDRAAVRAASGPLIIESYDSTIVVPPGAQVRADAFGNIRLELP